MAKEDIQQILTAIQEEANLTRTENGALTYRSSGSACLDLFGTIGALRFATDREILSRFAHAWAEDKNLAMKILFYSRDVRGGLGERRVFRLILAWLAFFHPESIVRNLKNIPEYGRYDDMLHLLDFSCNQDVLNFIQKQLKNDIQHLDEYEAKFGKPVIITDTRANHDLSVMDVQNMLSYCTSEKTGISLLAKWMPSINASSGETIRYAKKIANHLGMKPAQYRKTLTRLRAALNLLENYMRIRNYTFDYSKQPSKAIFAHRKAFLKNDHDRYSSYLDSVTNGTAKLHTRTLYPYEIIQPIVNARYTNQDESIGKVLDATWNAQIDYTQGKNALVVVDGSGSMYWNWGGREVLPAHVALSLAIYFAERNQGIFKDHFITFSTTPQLIKIKGKTIVDKVLDAISYDECANTNIEAVFKLILHAAVKHHIPQAELPETIYIISDMEFDACTENADITNFEKAKNKFASAGYTLPHIVFWNVESRNRQQPVAMNDRGVTLVSGCSPTIFEQVMHGTTPFEFMMQVLHSERYAGICA